MCNKLMYHLFLHQKESKILMADTKAQLDRLEQKS